MASGFFCAAARDMVIGIGGRRALGAAISIYYLATQPLLFGPFERIIPGRGGFDNLGPDLCCFPSLVCAFGF